MQKYLVRVRKNARVALNHLRLFQFSEKVSRLQLRLPPPPPHPLFEHIISNRFLCLLRLQWDSIIFDAGTIGLCGILGNFIRIGVK